MSVRARSDRPDRGQVLVLVVLSIVALLAFAALAFDIGRFYSEKRFLQNASDAAALAAANALIRGESVGDAETEARDVLTRNYASDPTGRPPALPSVTPIYEEGHPLDPAYLVDGVLISSSEVRVAVRNQVDYTLGRVVGLFQNTVTARSRATWGGHTLPIAVRQFVNAPGPSGLPTCTDNQSKFMDFFATAATACLGTDTDASLRTAPSAGNPFNTSNPDDDRTSHGPIVTILGQGAQPSNGSDFRGFIALDVRNFENATSQLYYNEVASGTNQNTLKGMEANWIALGGYPGPMFPPATTPPDYNDQVAIMSGNSTGAAIDAMAQSFAVGDEILVAVYPGQTMSIPDFTVSPPTVISLPTSGTVANAGSFKVSKNKEFDSVVTLSTIADSFDASNPMVLGTLVGANPISYTPNPVTPTQGGGTTVDMTNVTTSNAAAGVYTLWVKGEAGSPYLTVKYEPAGLKIGSVSRDFTLTSDISEAVAANAGDSVSFTLKVTQDGSAFGAVVNLTVDPSAPWGALPSGLGSINFSPSSVTPANGSGASSTLTINTGTVAPGVYEIVVRATGINSDGQRVTHLLPLSVRVGTASAGGNQQYVDIVGFAVMRIAYIDANRIDAYAITPMIADQNDYRLRRGQVARLAPWN